MNRLEKGLIVNAARKMGWIIRNHRFHFTVTDEIRPGKRERSKACNPKPDGSDKYFWHEGSSVTYYHAPNIKSEIDAAGGVVIFAAGEPDVLTFLEAGIHNVIAWFGEGNVPKTLAEDMKSLGVREILYWPDLDNTGHESAKKVRIAMRDTGIVCKIFELPAFLGKKADTNDLWVHHQGNTEAFKTDLANCKALILPNDEKPVKHTDLRNYEQTSDDGLIQLICNHWNLTEFAADGFSKQTVPVPFRADQNPSGAFNRHSGVLLDRATGIGYPKWKVAKALGIEWKRQQPEKPNIQRRKNSSVDEKMAEASASDINPKADSPSDEKPMRDWAKAVKLPIFGATIQVNLPYISNLDECHFENETLLIKSPLATGKTELFKRLIAYLEKKRGRSISVLVLTHVQALAENLAERFGIESYRDAPEGTGREYIDKMQQLVCSYDSIHMVAGRHFDLVLIDEHEQFHLHVVGGTMKGFEATRNHCILEDLVATASQVVVADAHMSDFSASWLASVRETSVTSIENLYRRNWGKLYLHRDAAQILELALANVRANQGPVVIVSNSRTATEVDAQIAIEEFGEGVMVVNGWNSARQDIQYFIRNIDQELPKLRLLICSPTFATGIDIQAQVAGVYGIFSQNNWGSAGSILQQIMRFRNAGERRLYVPPVFNGEEETDWKLREAHEMAKLRGTAEAAGFEAHNILIEDPAQKRILKLQSQLQAKRADERRELFSFVVARAKDEGFELQYDENQSSAMRERLQEARAALRDENRELTQSLEPLSPEAFDELRRAGMAGRPEHCQVNRWKIEYTAGQDINEELYDLLSTSKKRSDFNRVVDLLEDVENLHERDRNQALAGDLISKRNHYTKHHQLTSTALRLVFGSDFWKSREEVTEDQINERLQAWVTDHILEIEIYDIRPGLSRDPLNVLRRLMGTLKEALNYKRVRDGDRRYYVYFFDPEFTPRLKELAMIALAARRQREQDEACPKTVYAQSSNTILGQDSTNLPDEDGDFYERWLAQTRIPI